MKKRGISPLIATILIIGFVILLASMTFIWGGDIVNKYTVETEKESLAKLTCATKVNLNIKESCDLGTSIRIKIESLADQNIDSLVYRIFSPSDAVVNTLKDDNEINIQLAPFESKVFYPKYFAVGSMYSKPSKIEILPRILVNGEKSTCPGVSKEIKPCYILPSLNDITDWVIDSDGVQGYLEEIIDLVKENNLEDEEGIYATGTNTITITSKEFIIPKTAKTLFIRLLINGNSGDIKYNLKIGDIEYPITQHIIINEDGIVILGNQFLLTDDNKGKPAILTITKEGGGGIAITKLGYIETLIN